MGKADEVLRNSSNSEYSAISTNNGVVVASYNKSVTETITLDVPCKSLFFANDGVSDTIVVTVNGLDFHIKNEESLNEAFEPFTEITITNSGSEEYRLWVRK